MFTGLVEEIGVVRSIHRKGDYSRIEVSAAVVLGGTRVGDSIAINGACQTVTSLTPSTFMVDALAETLRKTTLGDLRIADKVHLERALSLAARLGGHLVQGHVNGRARIREVRRMGKNVYLVLSLPAELKKYCALEGSIAIDGVSLTICALAPGEIEVNLIPHTLASTTLGDKKSGDEVNIENDIIAKYVERLLSINREIDVGSGGSGGDGRTASRLETLLKSAF